MKRRDFLWTMGSLATAATLADSHSTLGATAEPKRPPKTAKSPLRFGDGRDWIFEKRFGLFLHWGLYSIPAWHEQQQWRLRVARDEYAKLALQWNPTKYDPDAWLDIAEKAGMQYVCFTTKHHDGFCMWDTKQTDYNVMRTPYGKDGLRALADACHRRGVPLCLYYSCVDWHHPNYPNQNRSHELPGPQPGDQPDLAKYMEFLKAQVRELCSNYGVIHGFWWDMNVTGHVDPAINQMIRRLQPTAVINNRGFDSGDYGTPEREYAPGKGEFAPGDGGPTPKKRRTEACQSVGMESWGFRKDEDYYTDRHLMRGIDQRLAEGDRYLLNVGPTAEGVFPPAATSILDRIGVWYHAIKESLEGVTSASHLTTNRNVLLTRRGNTLYVHLFKEPLGNAVNLMPLNVAPRRATLLNTGRPVEWVVNLPPSDFARRKPCLRLCRLPVNDLANSVPVVKLEYGDAKVLS
jgi:alpha-L-fucosidase